MPPKKKGKGNKLARMTDEERARYLQHRAELELEAKRRKQQLIAVFTKNKLKHEEAFSRLNIAKINEQWRYILRQIKCKQLYVEVEYLWRNFDRRIQTKDSIIQRLYRELEIADKDHKRLQEAHIDIIDKLIGRYKLKLTCLHDIFTDELESIQTNEMNELRELWNVMESNCEQVDNIILGQEKILENKISVTKIQNAVNIRSIMYLKEDMISDFLQTTTANMESLWGQLNEIIDEYEKTTESKRKQYEYLKKQDDTHQTETAQYPKLHSQLQNNIDALKDDLQTLSRRRSECIEELKTQADTMKKRIVNLRQDFSTAQIIDASQLKKLSVTSNNVLKDLRRTSEKSSVLLLLIKMCTELQPVLFNLRKYFLHDMEDTESSPRRMSEPFDKLENFWEQYNNIKADNIMMKRECNKLSFENKQLRQTLRTYLISISRTPMSRPLTSITV
ncbi:hypothetical protein KM043_015095 [Ampulex compressa]|nr:hypothetical protein KM043_015095 [Ampulex compressa]